MEGLARRRARPSRHRVATGQIAIPGVEGHVSHRLGRTNARNGDVTHRKVKVDAPKNDAAHLGHVSHEAEFNRWLVRRQTAPLRSAAFSEEHNGKVMLRRHHGSSDLLRSLYLKRSGEEDDRNM